MLVYKSRKGDIRIKGDEIEDIEVRVKEILSRPKISLAIVPAFHSPTIQVLLRIEVIINDEIIDTYTTYFKLGEDMLGNFEYWSSLSDDDLNESIMNRWKSERDYFYECALRRVKEVDYGIKVKFVKSYCSIYLNDDIYKKIIIGKKTSDNILNCVKEIYKKVSEKNLEINYICVKRYDEHLVTYSDCENLEKLINVYVKNLDLYEKLINLDNDFDFYHNN